MACVQPRSRPGIPLQCGAFRMALCVQSTLEVRSFLLRRTLRDAAGERARDLAANDAFWAKYEGKIAEVSNQINDAYLKSNGQEQGVKSYDKMVDMLVVYVLDILAE